MPRLAKLALTMFIALPIAAQAQNLPQGKITTLTLKAMLVNKNGVKMMTLENKDAIYLLICNETELSCLTPSVNKEYVLSSERVPVLAWLAQTINFAYQCDNVLLWPNADHFDSAEIGVYCLRTVVAN